jgi:hypothetical protein
MKVQRHGKQQHSPTSSLRRFWLLLLLQSTVAYGRCSVGARRGSARPCRSVGAMSPAVRVTFRRATTKTKATRQLLQAPALAEELAGYKQQWAEQYGHLPKPSEALFPAAGSTTSTMSRQAADLAFRGACKAAGIEGASLHSFRRTMAQSLVAKGVPLPTVQKATGHKSLSSLGEYLTASEEDVSGCNACLRRSRGQWHLEQGLAGLKEPWRDSGRFLYCRGRRVTPLFFCPPCKSTKEKR